MITPADLIRLPYTPDLTQAGIAYALRSLADPLVPQGGAGLAHLRRVTAEKASELAFRRCLHAQEVVHKTLQTTPFTEPERYDVVLGGWRCDLRCTWLRRERLIQHIYGQPGLLLNEVALVPAEHQAASEPWTGHDLYLFAFVLGRVAAGWTELCQAVDAGQTSWLVRSLPASWSRPAAWNGLGRLALKAEHATPLTVELGGQAENRRFQTETMLLAPGERTFTNQAFYSLATLHVPSLPEGRVGVYSPQLRRAYLVPRRGWGDLWLRGVEVILAGWMPRAEFLRRARFVPAGSRALQTPCTSTPCLALPVAELYPLADLFTRAREWQASHRS